MICTYPAQCPAKLAIYSYAASHGFCNAMFEFICIDKYYFFANQNMSLLISTLRFENGRLHCNLLFLGFKWQ